MLKKKIHELRQQPEEVRLKALTRFTFAAGIVLGIIWLAVFLPIQLALHPTKVPLIPTIPATPNPTVDAAVTALPERPKPTTTVTPIDSAPVDILPTTEDQVSPTPTPK